MRRATTVATTPLAKKQRRSHGASQVKPRIMKLEKQIETERRCCDHHRPGHRDGEDDHRGNRHDQHDVQMPLIKRATGADAHQGDREQDEEHAGDQREPLQPGCARFSPDEGGGQGCGRKDAGGQEHRQHDRQWKQDGVEAQGHAVQQSDPDHPGANDLGRLRPRTFPKKSVKLAFQADVACAARQEALDLRHDSWTSHLKRRPRGCARRVHRNCVLLNVHLSGFSGASPAGKNNEASDRVSLRPKVVEMIGLHRCGTHRSWSSPRPVPGCKRL